MTRVLHKTLIAFSLCLVQLAATSSIAVPITWTLSGAVFDDGGTASGSFAYDAGSNTYSAINMTTTAGSAFAGASYHALHPTAAFDSSNVAVVPDASLADLTGSPALSLSYLSPLTSLGGTVGLSAFLPEASCSNATCSAAAPLRSLTSGTLSASLPITFLLNGVTFGDGGTASGSFVYDVLNNIYSGIDITTTAGAAFGGTHYGGLAQAGSSATQFFATDGSFSAVKFTVTFTTPLDSPDAVDGAGFDSFIVGQEDQCLDAACSNVSPLRPVTAGSVSAAVPAPSSLILGLMGGLALLAGRRRRQKYEDATR